jgi:hypothetical protein
MLGGIALVGEGKIPSFGGRMNYVDMQATTTLSRLLRVSAVAISTLATVAQAAIWSFEGDLAARASAVAEGLSVRVTPGLVAESATVEAFAADLAAIYALDAGLAAATPWRAHADAIVVQVDPSITPSELLSAFPSEVAVEEEIRPYGFRQWLVLDFGVGVNAPNLAAWALANVEGILAAAPNATVGDGDDVVYHPEADLYAFKRGEGDCPSGCIVQDWRFVLMSASGPVEVTALELDVILTGALQREPTETLKVARGDRLPLGRLAVDPFTVSHGGELITAEALSFGHAGAFGTYTVTVRRPYGLAPVVHTIEIEERQGGAFLTGERTLDGWLHSPDFGWVHDQSFPWTFHESHGWVYLHSIPGVDDHGWAYEPKLGWFSLSCETYPWVYSPSSGWLYYMPGTSAPRLFFQSETASWMQLD